MKTNGLTALLLIIAASAIGQTRPSQHGWTATVKVVDGTGEPVAGAETWISYSLPSAADESKAWGKVTGLTDTNGLFRASHSDSSASIGFHAKKAGYYSGSTAHFFGFSTDEHSVDWNPTETLVLIKIGRPTPMYAKRQETKMPKEDQPVAFDLIVGDWVAPFGAGKTSDFLFTVHRQVANRDDYTADVKLAFPKAGDGIVVQSASGPNTAVMRTAPEQGYESNRVWHYTASVRPENASGYFFRVRTVLGEKGDVKSALYGKVRGDFRLYVGTKAPRAGIGFDYYLNPTPNDRNVEFDPVQNMFKRLPLDELLRDP